MNRNREWISISDMMSGLMMVFLFIAIVFMQQVEKDKLAAEKVKTDMAKIAKTYDISKQSLNRALHKEFDRDLKKWGAEILSNNTVRFHEPDVLFALNSSEIKDAFKTILDDFIPRYLKILTNPQFKNEIIELRIEGHTSSGWRKNSTREESYIGNAKLSQDRSFSVLKYVFNLDSVESDRQWLIDVLRANGLSYSKLIRDEHGDEDQDQSRRVEFRIITNTEAKIEEILNRAESD